MVLHYRRGGRSRWGLRSSTATELDFGHGWPWCPTCLPSLRSRSRLGSRGCHLVTTQRRILSSSNHRLDRRLLLVSRCSRCCCQHTTDGRTRSRTATVLVHIKWGSFQGRRRRGRGSRRRGGRRGRRRKGGRASRG